MAHKYLPSSERAKELLESDLAYLDKSVNSEFLILASMSTLTTVAKDFPCLILSTKNTEYQRLLNLVDTKIRSLQNHEAASQKKRGDILRKDFDQLQKEIKFELENQKRESSAKSTLVQVQIKDTFSFPRVRTPTVSTRF